MQPEPLDRAIQFSQQESEQPLDKEDTPLAKLELSIRIKNVIDFESGSYETLD